MAERRVYTIKQNRWKKAVMAGLEIVGNNIKCIYGYSKRSVFLGALDGVEEGTEWGRFCLEGEFSGDMVFIIHVLAMDNKEIETILLNKEIDAAYKKEIFKQKGEIRAVSQKDILLFSQKGRYLWIFIEIMGEGKGIIKQIKVYAPEDSFLKSFPEIYQEKNSFFDRYLSIFSSIYYDFQEEIDGIESILSVDKTPVQILPVLASWFGVDLGETVLPEKKLRMLVKELYQLNKYKGTRYVLSRITEIVIGEKPIIIEQKEDRACIILLKRQVEEEERWYLRFLFDQFKPVRSYLKLIFLDQEGRLDDFCYLDWNGRICQEMEGSLDKKQSLDKIVFLQ